MTGKIHFPSNFPVPFLMQRRPSGHSNNTATCHVNMIPRLLRVYLPIPDQESIPLSWNLDGLIYWTTVRLQDISLRRCLISVYSGEILDQPGFPQQKLLGSRGMYCPCRVVCLLSAEFCVQFSKHATCTSTFDVACYGPKYKKNQVRFPFVPAL